MSPGLLARVGAWLERTLLGPNAEPYRAFVRALVVATALLVAANALVVFGIVPVGDAVADALWAAGAVAVTLFVLAGLVQVVVLARAFERGTREVAETAAELETTAADVAETADELETAAEDVETAADEVETVVPDVAGEGATAGDSSPDPEVVTDEAADRVADAKERAAEARSRTEAAKETASDAEETAAERRERVAGGEDAVPEPDDGSDDDPDEASESADDSAPEADETDADN